MAEKGGSMKKQFVVSLLICLSAWLVAGSMVAWGRTSIGFMPGFVWVMLLVVAGLAGLNAVITGLDLITRQ